MAKTSVMTLRIDPELLAAVKARAKRLGRSASAEVVFLLERELATVASKPRSRSVMGMFQGFDDLKLGEFQRERRAAAQVFLGAARASRT